MANWQPPPSWQNDAARRAQAVHQQVNAQMTERARWNAEHADHRYRQRTTRAPRRNPAVRFIKFIITLTLLAMAAYAGYRVLHASVHIH